MTTEKRTYEKLHEGKYENLKIFFNSHSRYPPSYTAYRQNEKDAPVIDISGFPARQLEELESKGEVDFEDFTCDIMVEKMFSQKYNKSYLRISSIKSHKIMSYAQSRLKVETD